MRVCDERVGVAETAAGGINRAAHSRGNKRRIKMLRCGPDRPRAIRTTVSVSASFQNTMGGSGVQSSRLHGSADFKRFKSTEPVQQMRTLLLLSIAFLDGSRTNQLTVRAD